MDVGWNQHWREDCVYVGVVCAYMDVVWCDVVCMVWCCGVYGVVWCSVGVVCAYMDVVWCVWCGVVQCGCGVCIVKVYIKQHLVSQIT